MTSRVSATGWFLLSNALMVAACAGKVDFPIEQATSAAGARAGRGGAGGAGGRAGAGAAGRGGSSSAPSGSNGETARAGSAAPSGGGNNTGSQSSGSQNNNNSSNNNSNNNNNQSDDDAGTNSTSDSDFSFFVSSQTSKTGDLGGIEGADERCQELAAAVGHGAKTWRAYLSAENDGSPINARDRIGRGPWFNIKGVKLADDVDDLHERVGNADVFLDENGDKIKGQWEGSGTPVEHDVLTGSTADGKVMAGMTCRDWTSDSNDDAAQVGHSDGLGPNRNDQAPYSSWNSAHANAGCADTAPRGGSGRIYCFAQ